MCVCKFSNMDKCAKQYCDFWNNKEHACALALEAHEKVKLLRKLNYLYTIVDELNQKKPDRKEPKE